MKIFDAKTMFLGASFALTSLALSSIGYADTTQKQLDLTKVNTSIATALQQFNSQDDTIDSLSYSFNLDLTDLDRDRYFFNVALDLPRTPWGSDPMHAEGILGFYTDTTDPKETGFSLSVDAIYQTDTLAMLKYKITSISNCNLSQMAEGVMGVLWNRHCQFVERLTEVNSVEALHDFLQEKIATHGKDMRSYMTDLDLAISQLSVQQDVDSNKALALLNSEITKVQKAMDFIGKVVLERTKQGFSIQTPAFDGCPILGSNGMKLSVSADSLHIVGDVHLKFGKSLYLASRPVIREILQGLEKGEPYAIKLVQLDAEGFSNYISDMIDHAQNQQNQ